MGKLKDIVLKIIEPNLLPLIPQYLQDYRFKPLIDSLPKSTTKSTIWMINSTTTGGGVAEMLPTLVSLLRELGYNVKWAVVESDDPEFFDLTKRIHNLIHDASTDRHFTNNHKILFEKVKNQLPPISKDDIVFIHDPQPLPLTLTIKPRKLFWRCHIGLPYKTLNTTAVWNFLKPYISTCDKSIFSLKEYSPDSFIIHPAIDPLSNKNKILSVQEIIDILRSIDESLLSFPYILQVSRWDKLKGWIPLIKGFAEYAESNPDIHLVLAGPEPSSIADDPEGQITLNEIINYYKNLPPNIAKYIHILLLPMNSKNALMVNALQSKALFVVQNSIQEGFGLSVTEAMWKYKPILGTNAAGIKTQVSPSCGILSNSHDEIANNIYTLLNSDLTTMGKNAASIVYNNFLIFRQIKDYISLL